jgi:hypothetical protein
MRDDGDSNGKGRGALRKVWFVGLLAISATILVGVATKENGETLMEWGSDVAEVRSFYFPPSFLLLVLTPQIHACAHFVSFSFLVLVPALELARISSLLNRVSSQASVASIAGLGSYVGKGPTAAKENDESIEGRMREEGGDAEGSIARTSVQGGPASEATTSDACPRCVKRAQMHLNRALASGETLMGSKDEQDHRKE